MSERHSLSEAERAFLDTLVSRSPRTATTYRSALNRFREFLAAAGRDLETLTTDQFAADELERFYAWLVRVYGRDDRFTIGTYVAGARAFFRFLSRRSLLAPSLSFEQLRDNLREVMGRSSYKTPRIDDRLALIVTHVDALELPPAAENGIESRLELLRDRAMIRTLFATGMRREEVTRLNRQDVQDGRARQAIISGKGDKERVVFFDEPSLRAIRAYVEARSDSFEPLFLRHDRARGRPGPAGRHYRLSPQSVWGVVKRYAEAVGIRASTHDFRHSKATVMLNRGAKLSEVQDILGHASPETTKRIYAHYETSHLRDVFDRFSATAEELAEAALETASRP